MLVAILPMRSMFNAAGCVSFQPLNTRRINAPDYNDSGIWNWNTHDGDWIYPGGDDYTAVKHNMMYNSINDLDDSPVGWHITEPVDVNSTEPWLSAVGGGLY